MSHRDLVSLKPMVRPENATVHRRAPVPAVDSAAAPSPVRTKRAVANRQGATDASEANAATTSAADITSGGVAADHAIEDCKRAAQHRAAHPSALAPAATRVPANDAAADHGFATGAIDSPAVRVLTDGGVTSYRAVGDDRAACEAEHPAARIVVSLAQGRIPADHRFRDHAGAQLVEIDPAASFG